MTTTQPWVEWATKEIDALRRELDHLGELVRLRSAADAADRGEGVSLKGLDVEERRRLLKG